jgi:NAD(P)H-flavin reductase/hemoglobin-like flavoprotein
MSTLAVLLKESWSHVEDRADDLVNHLYARMFLEDPNLRDLFPVAMTEQRSRLIHGIVSIIQTVDDPDALSAHLGALGRSHRRFHVEPQHYGIVGTALLESLKEYAGDHWSIEYDQAWRDAYDLMATQMLTAAERNSRTPAYWHAEVIGHERRGRDIAVVLCRPLTSFSYQAGQYVHLETPQQPRLWRPFSIANAPRPDGTIEFHVRAPRGGWVSSALVRRLAVGDMIRIGPPAGRMILDRESEREIVCVAGGTGLAPIKALVEELTRFNHTRWVHVFVGAKDRDDLYDLPALNRLAGRYPWLTVVPACSEDPGYVGERGPINEVVERYGPWSDHDFFVCGSAEMVKATVGSLAGLGVPARRVRYDALGSGGW